MRQIFKRLLAPLLLMTALPTSVSQADGIRLVGPTGEVQSSPSFSEQVERANSPLPVSDEPSRFYGPTSANETLWSIASKLRPANNVSVQQTLLAIYRLNPQAFENQNIHSLVPGSTLRVPSLAQVRSASTEQAVTVMKAHQDKLNATSRPVAPTPVTRPVKVTPATPAQAVSETVKVESPVDTTPVKTPDVPQVKTLEKQLEMSESELTALEEKNHNLRLMLAEVQSEVDGLKTELGDENRIRSEVEKLLAEEKAKLEEQQRMQPSAFDQFLSNGWMVAAAALIPGALIGLLIVMLLGRRKEAEPSASETQTEAPLTPPPMSDSDLDDLTDDLTLDDDLFSDSDDNSELLFDDTMGDDENDVFGDLDDSDLDFNLEGEDGEDPFASIGDDGDLDTDFDDFDSSNNGISVKGSDKALGLEEMERALDEVSPELEITDDEESDFDLSGENVGMSEDDLAELLASDEPTEDLGDSALDQSMLDDLFSNLGDDDEVDEFDLGLDEDSAAAPTENKQMSDAMSGTMASDEDIDQLLAQFDEPVIDESELETPSSLDELESLLESGADDTQDDLSTSLLDEMLEQASDDEVSLDPLDELEALAGLSDDEIEVSPTDTELLDELLEADEEESLDEFDPLSELEELAAFGQDEVVPELDENSTDLLDELLESAPESDESLEWPEEELATAEESDLFDELIGLDESDKAQEGDAAEPFDFAAELDAALDSSEDFVELSVSEPAIEEGNTEGDLVDNTAIDDLLDDVLPLEEASPKQDEPTAEVEELVESIDSPMAGDEFEPTEFNSSHFVEDLANVAPTLDPLLDAFPEDIEEASTAEAELDTDPQTLQESLEDSTEALLEEAAPSEPVLPTELLADLPVEEGESGDIEDIDAQDDQNDDWLQAAIDEIESPRQSIDEYEPTTQTETAEQELLSDHEIATTTPELDVEESQEPQEEDWLQSAIDEVESPQSDLEQHEVDSDEHLASTPLATEVTEEALDEHPDDAMLSELDATPAQDDELVDLVDDIAEPVSTDAEALLAQDIEDAQELEAPATEMPLEEPVHETPTPNAVPNEFGTPVEEDWAEAETLFDGLVTDSELPQAQQEESLAGLVEAESTAEQDDSLDDLELLEFDEEDALEALADESAQEANAVLGEDAIGLDELALNEFGEDDELAVLADEPGFAEPSLESELEDIDLDELDFPEFGEEEALASLEEEPMLSEVELSESELVTPPIDEAELLEQAESAVANLDGIEFDESELPEFGEEDALSAMADEPSLADFELDEPVEEGEIDLADEVEFDELELPEFGEDEALAAMADEPSYDAPVMEEDAFAAEEPAVESKITSDDSALDEVLEPSEVATDNVESAEEQAQAETTDDVFDFDELELPEFGEDEALAAMADEPSYDAPVVEEEVFAAEEPAVESEVTSEESALDEVLEPSEVADDNVESAEEQAQAETTDDAFDFDELELPEFGEDEALVAMADEPSYDAPLVEEEAFAAEEPAVEFETTSDESALDKVLEPSEAATDNVESAEEQVQAEITDDAFDFDELELPEFGEDEALAAMADEPSYDAPVVEEDAFATEEPAVESEITSDESALDEVLEPSEAATDNVESAEEQAQAEITDDAFDFDELELPEFGEDEAAEAVASEPNIEPDAEPEAESDDFEIDELDLPEFGEEDAIVSVAEELEEAPITSEPEEQDYHFDSLELPSIEESGELNTVNKPHINPSSYEEQDALFDVFAQEAGFNIAEEEVLHSEFDEAAMAHLLSEDALDDNFFPESPDDEMAASAGMDIEAMLEVGGDDWNGFKLPDNPSAEVTSDVPAEEREIWSSEEALRQPNIDEENWAEQDDFDPKKNQYMTIDELMAQVDGDEVEFEEEDLKLDVGLDEFPDVIGDISNVDVDENAEASGKLDLAKIYIEMNDAEGAIKLLEEAIVYGDDDVRREAKNLIDMINGR